MTWLIGVIILMIAISFLFIYIKAELIVYLRDDSDWQGIKIKIISRFYNLDHTFDYNDPHLNLMEVILESAYEARQRYLFLEKLSVSQPEAARKLFVPRIIRSFLESQKVLTFLSFTTFDKIEWFSIVGGQDPCDAAMKTGVLWGFKGSLLGWLSCHCKVDNVKANIQPNFSNPDYSSHIKCILKMRLVHIITIESLVIALKVRWWINGFRANPAQSSY